MRVECECVRYTINVQHIHYVSFNSGKEENETYETLTFCILLKINVHA